MTEPSKVLRDRCSRCSLVYSAIVIGRSESSLAEKLGSRAVVDPRHFYRVVSIQWKQYWSYRDTLTKITQQFMYILDAHQFSERSNARANVIHAK